MPWLTPAPQGPRLLDHPVLQPGLPAGPCNAGRMARCRSSLWRPDQVGGTPGVLMKKPCGTDTAT